MRLKFSISRAEARDIVLKCSKCADFISQPNVGIKTFRYMQMNVTHVQSFGKQQYVHVSADTSSGVMHATPL